MSTTPDDSSSATTPTPAPEAVSIQLDPVTEAALALVIARSALSPRRSPLTHDQALAQAVREGGRILAEGVLREWGWGRYHTRHIVDAPPPLPDASETTGPIAAIAQLDTLTKAALRVVMMVPPNQPLHPTGRAPALRAAARPAGERRGVRPADRTTAATAARRTDLDASVAPGRAIIGPLTMRRQMALKKPPCPTVLPDLTLLDGVVAPRILDAMRIASEHLTKVGIRHALVGGLAVGAHGHPRAIKDVEFLVGEEAFAHRGGGLVTIAPGVLTVRTPPACRGQTRRCSRQCTQPREFGSVPSGRSPRRSSDNFHGTGDHYARP